MQFIGYWRPTSDMAERSVQAETEAYKNLKATYQRFIDEQEPARKDEAGKDLIRAIFGKGVFANQRAFGEEIE